MPVTYERADEEVKQIMRRLINQHHRPLANVNCLIAVLMAFGARDSNGIQTGPALKVGGYEFSGIMRVLSLKDRALTGSDAVMTLDGDIWQKLDLKRCEALVDHQLQHLAVNWDLPPAKNGDGGVAKRDDLNRPRLWIRRHDWQIGGFREVARRHGLQSIEVDEARTFRDRFGQYVFDFSARDGDSSTQSNAEHPLDFTKALRAEGAGGKAESV